MLSRKFLFFYVLTLCFLPTYAFAYVDPGSGYLVWQIIVAAFVGSLFFIKKIGNGLQRLMKRLRTPKASNLVESNQDKKEKQKRSA